MRFLWLTSCATGYGFLRIDVEVHTGTISFSFHDTTCLSRCGMAAMEHGVIAREKGGRPFPDCKRYNYVQAKPE